MSFEDFLKSARETDEKEVEDYTLEPGEKVVRFQGDVWMLRRADGEYDLILGNCEWCGHLRDVAVHLYHWAISESRI